MLITAAAVSYQEGLRRRGGTEGRGWGAQAALTERSVRGWVLGGEEGGGGMGGQGDFVCWSLGAYGPNTCQVSHKQVTCLTSPGCSEDTLEMCLNVVFFLLFFFSK